MGTKQRWIMHVDMDAFFCLCGAAGPPGIPGQAGDCWRVVRPGGGFHLFLRGPEVRGPFSHAHDPGLAALSEAIFVTGRYDRYTELSQQIQAIFREFSPAVEPLSIDEAFLDLTGMDKLVGDVRTLGPKIKQTIRERTGLTASVGLAPNKFLAKLASDLEKPDGLVIIEPGEEAARIAPLPLSKVFGLGQRSVAALKNLGLTTIGQLAACDLRVLQPPFGTAGGRNPEPGPGAGQPAGGAG